MRSALAMLAGFFFLIAPAWFLIAPAWADAPADAGWTQAEAWAWSHIEAGEPASFDQPCGASTAPPADPALWNAACRTLRGTVLEQMLTRLPWRDAMPHQGLRIIGAHVTGGLDLTNAHIPAALVLIRSRIEGDVALSRAHLDGLLALDGSIIVGTIDATGLESESDVSLADARQLGHQTDPIGVIEAQQTVGLRNAQIKGSLYLNGGLFHQMVDLRGIHIDDELQTSGAHFLAPLWVGSALIGVKASINATRFDGDVLFSNTTIGGLVDASASIFGGTLNLVDTRIAGEVFLNKLVGTGGIELSGSQIGGNAYLVGASSKGPVNAIGTQIAGDLQFDDKVHFESPLTLSGARVGGMLLMSNARFGGLVSLRGTHVLGNGMLDGASFEKDLDFISIRVDGDFVLRGVDVAGNLVATDADVEHDLTLAKGHFHDSANLFDAHVRNTLHMEDASFDKGIFASSIQVSGDMLLNGSTFGDAVVLEGARIGGDLTLSGAHLGRLDLTGAAIDGALQVDATTTWVNLPGAAARQLTLVNARLGGIQDGVVGKDEACPTSAKPNGWPAGAQMELDGFVYNHLGASAGAAGADMRERDVCWWRGWLERDPDFSSQPYVQLAAVMTAHGDQDSAADVLYFGRVRETQIAWESGHYLRWMLLSALNLVTGYGIGTYTFRALYWIIGLTALGVVLLTWSPGGGGRTLLWRTGASLTRVLPGIEINKEFTDFFDDPERQRLHDWQVAVFSAFVVIGWVLGLFLVAAMTGLTQHS
jgi:hypothetical protein